MAEAAAEALGPKVIAGMMTAEPESRAAGAAAAGTGLAPPRWQAFAAGHPLPNEASESAGRAALAMARAVRDPGDLLLVCLSGGASAMLCVPAPGLALEDKRQTNVQLLRAGLDIGAMNVVRRHLSAIKGGQLAAAAARTITLAISDVTRPTDDDPLTIGSGPTVGDASTFDDALRLIDQAGLRTKLPPAVTTHLEGGRRGRAPGPVPPDDPRLRAAAYWVVASRHDAMRGAADAARTIGYEAHVIEAALDGEARRAPEAILLRARTLRRPACLIASGETTVQVVGSGRGGRNQEVAVAALELLAQCAPAALASVGTDGVDGPTDAAGAIVDSEMWGGLGSDAAEAVRRALDRNDAYPLLHRLGALVRTGPTGTNVGDVVMILLP